MKISFMEIFMVCIVALVVLGPNKLPIYARKLGYAMKEFKKAASTMTDEIKENVVEPMNEAAQPMKEAFEPVTQMKQEIEESLKDVQKSVEEIGK